MGIMKKLKRQRASGKKTASEQEANPNMMARVQKKDARKGARKAGRVNFKAN